MKREELENIISAEVDTLCRYAGRIQSVEDVEDIHQFRVTYKKLRAFLRLVHAGGHKRPLAPIKHIYTVAGEARDMQVHLPVIAAWLEQDGHEDAVYPGTLKRKIEDVVVNLRQELRGLNVQNLTDMLTEDLPAHLGKYKVEEFVHNQAVGFYEHIKDDATDEQLHTARKHLKDLVYNAGFLRADKVEQSFLEQHKEIKKLASLLGEYHDKQTLIAHLQALPEDGLPVNEQESLSRLQQKLNLEKQELKTTIRKASKRLMNNAGESAIGTVAQAGLLVGSAIVAGLAVFFFNYINRRSI